MKVDAGAQRLVLDLADADAEIARLQHRRSKLPEDAEIAEVYQESDSGPDLFACCCVGVGGECVAAVCAAALTIVP